jgi:phage regulator Rha-like protein
MSTEDFVKGFFQLKQELLASYFEAQSDKTMVADMIQQMNLAPNDSETLYNVLDAAITDTMYTILLGLDGEASIGNRQEVYKLYSEEGKELTGTGNIESYAYEYFHNSRG